MQCLYLCDQMILSIIASDLSHIWHVIKFLPSSFLLLNSISVCVTQCVISSRWASIWRKNPESYILKCVFLGVRIIIFFFFFFFFFNYQTYWTYISCEKWKWIYSKAMPILCDPLPTFLALKESFEVLICQTWEYSIWISVMHYTLPVL